MSIDFTANLGTVTAHVTHPGPGVVGSFPMGDELPQWIFVKGNRKIDPVTSGETVFQGCPVVTLPLN